MEIDYDYLRTGTAIGFRASPELCSNYFFLYSANTSLLSLPCVRTTFTSRDFSTAAPQSGTRPF